ncbi:erythrocyte membrane antigen 1 [Plasmodium berghei ANKA]|uniref:Erythrocyte membrane antigen 1 n=1 Tax=Plasmodium berghei (strain Anka) TaxID=5823 RepID=A0A509AKD8_PLABA|nr:erythrocyte membrane antigen 1 [Plasmodium berghei ANKA]VUC56004.1 erythrocyte membrane antigen 1 [Plasmodium berghei ANKA]|eukprot:XP_034421806.1 erythrocyte membrane antigen 1 [Plasmodium berghei ANKA]
MKVISLGLISSIIFSIFLAKKNSGSNSTTGCFPFCKKKKNGVDHVYELAKSTDCDPKGIDYDPDLPNLKFIDEPTSVVLEVCNERKSKLSELFASEIDDTVIDQVNGFLRRENKSSKKGWYVRPYEEYENMINIKFISVDNDAQPLQHSLNIAHKLSTSPEPPKVFEKHRSSPISETDTSIPHENDESTLHEDQELDDEVTSYLGDGENTNEDQELDDEVTSYLGDGENTNEDQELDDEVTSYLGDGENTNEDQELDDEVTSYLGDGENTNEDQELDDEVTSYLGDGENANEYEAEEDDAGEEQEDEDAAPYLGDKDEE